MLDKYFMHIALRLSQRAVAAPNPAVGCVIVKDNQIIGRGWTGRGGRPHAEVAALERSGKAAKGATAYVTLEPCCHHGKTPPCTDALINAGIRRVVVACEDPYHEVSGGGLKRLREAGIEVTVGICREEAEKQHAGFFLRVKEQRPYVTLKLAVSKDGMIAAQKGERTHITGELAQRYTHMLRRQHDAVMVGINTVLTDDPLLTCRLPGLEQDSPMRVVLDSTLRLPPRSKLAQTAQEFPVRVITCHPDKKNKAALESAGIEIIEVEKGAKNAVNLREALYALAVRGVNRLLVEGGAEVASALMQNHLVDKLILFRSPHALGKDGISAPMLSQDDFITVSSRPLGVDTVTVYERRR